MMRATTLYSFVFSVFASLFTPNVLAHDYQQFLKALSAVTSHNKPDNKCPSSKLPVSPSCPGLPAILDASSMKSEGAPKGEDYKVTDSLLHAKCSHIYASSCTPLKIETLENIRGGMITSSARYSTKNLQEALIAHKRVSDFVSSTKGTFKGLCDISFYSDYGLEEIRECLKMPGMIGVGELNVNGEGTFSSTNTTEKSKILIGYKSQAYQRFFSIAETVQNSGGGVITTHFADVYEPSVPNTEIDTLIEIAKRFPKVTFVIAHSGQFHGGGVKSFGLDGLKKIGAHYRSDSSAPRNIWTDLSAIMGDLVAKDAFPNQCAFLKRQAEFALAWREFGIDRVLFGSDDDVISRGFENKGWIEKSVTALISNPFLSQNEKKQILSQNLQSLFSSH